MTTRKLNDLYHRIINSDNRLQQLRQMRAPDIILRTENRLLEDSVGALLNDEDVTHIVDHVGTDAFVKYFNYITGIQIRFPIPIADRCWSHAV